MSFRESCCCWRVYIWGFRSLTWVSKGSKSEALGRIVRALHASFVPSTTTRWLSGSLILFYIVLWTLTLCDLSGFLNELLRSGKGRLLQLLKARAALLPYLQSSLFLRTAEQWVRGSDAKLYLVYSQYKSIHINLTPFLLSFPGLIALEVNTFTAAWMFCWWRRRPGFRRPALSMTFTIMWSKNWIKKENLSGKVKHVNKSTPKRPEILANSQPPPGFLKK